MTQFCIVLLAALAQPPDDLSAADETILREGKVGTEEAALRDFFRRRSPTAADQKQIDTLVRQLGERAFARRQQATDALIAWGPAALESLKQSLRGTDIEAVRRAQRCIEEIERPGIELPLAAIRQLARRKPADSLAILLAYAPSAGDEAVFDAILTAILALGNPKTPDEPLLRALSDRSAARRSTAAHALGRHTQKSARAAVAKLLADSELSVRFRAAQALLHGREKLAVPALIDLLRTAPDQTRWQVEELLARLPACIKGEPVIPAAPPSYLPENLGRWGDNWRDWWVKHEAAADLAKLEDRPAFQNLTLVPEMHAHKVWEYGPDGKTRWEIAKDLQSPIDAQVLTTGRVLIAELNGNRVTERDRAGKILWQHAVKTPIYCRRMPNGNTFISTNHACFIVTPAGKEVFRHDAEQTFYIHSIQQMPGGQIVCISMNGGVRELAADGKVVRTIQLEERGSWSGIEGLPGNRYLCVGGGRVREIDAAGKVLWKFNSPSACYATRLPTGNTLVVDGSRGLLEVTREGKIVTERKLNTNLWRAHRR